MLSKVISGTGGSKITQERKQGWNENLEFPACTLISEVPNVYTHIQHATELATNLVQKQLYWRAFFFF